MLSRTQILGVLIYAPGEVQRQEIVQGLGLRAAVGRSVADEDIHGAATAIVDGCNTMFKEYCLNPYWFADIKYARLTTK